MTNDRNYWRACDDKRLIEEAYASRDELTIALGERLECVIDIVDEAIALRQQRDELDARCDALRDELNGLYAAIERG